MGPLGIGPFHDELRSGMPMNRPVELVLHLGKKLFCVLGGVVVVQHGGVDVAKDSVAVLLVPVSQHKYKP